MKPYPFRSLTLNSGPRETVFTERLSEPIEHAENYSVALTEIRSTFKFKTLQSNLSIKLAIREVKFGVGALGRLTPSFLGEPRLIAIADVLEARQYSSFEEVFNELNFKINKGLDHHKLPTKKLYFQRARGVSAIHSLPFKYQMGQDDSGRWFEVFSYFTIYDDDEGAKKLFAFIGLDASAFNDPDLYLNEENWTPKDHLIVPLLPRPTPGPPISSYFLCIYCSNIRPALYGNSFTQLLASFPLPSTQIFQQRIQVPIYMPLNCSHLTEMTIYLGNENGEVLNALEGAIELVLQLRAI